MLAYYLIIFLIIGCIVIKLDTPQLEQPMIYLIGVTLICFAGFRGYTVGKDMLQYVKIFDSQIEYSDYFSGVNEPMATIIPVSFKCLDLYTDRIVFVLFAILGVSFKISAIRKYSVFPLFSILIYFSHFFLLHEMTQIRAGVAVGILMLTIGDIYYRRKYLFLSKVLCASLFHYSALIFLFAYFLNPIEINVRKYFIYLVLCIILAATKAVNILTFVPLLSSFSKKLQIYENLNNIGGMLEISLFTITSISYILIIMLLIKNIKRIQMKYCFGIIVFKLYYFSLIFFYLFSSIAVFSMRVSEIFAVFSIFAIPLIILCLKSKPISYLMVIFLALLYLTSNLFKQNLVGNYYAIWSLI